MSGGGRAEFYLRDRPLTWHLAGELVRHLQMNFEGGGVRVHVSVSVSVLYISKRQRLHFPAQDPSCVSASSQWKGDAVFISNTTSRVRAWGCCVLWIHLSLHMSLISLCHRHSFVHLPQDHIKMVNVGV